MLIAQAQVQKRACSVTSDTFCELSIRDSPLPLFQKMSDSIFDRVEVKETDMDAVTVKASIDITREAQKLYKFDKVSVLVWRRSCFS
ncbi:hypothetical protein L596_005821 [Steinernema carpocapsae]|uniref:Uncharacterized protein n=1 Tax=Steinernema carpocapsae TaxID=34508 RepID=A0A4U8V0H6_STECR|nr:hypothetical protein L596_005821 [Steinernema carpocapsae]